MGLYVTTYFTMISLARGMKVGDNFIIKAISKEDAQKLLAKSDHTRLITEDKSKPRDNDAVKSELGYIKGVSEKYKINSYDELLICQVEGNKPIRYFHGTLS